MRTLLLLLAASLFLGSANATIGYVASTSVANPSNSASTTTSAIDTTGATLLVIAESDYGADGCTYVAPTDSKSNSWTCAGSYSSPDTGSYIAIWYSIPTTVGTGHTFTLHVGYLSFAVAAFSGTASSSVFDVKTGAGQNSGLTLPPGTLTPSANNELLIAVGAGSVNGLNVSSVDSPFSSHLVQNVAISAVNNSVALAYEIQTTATARNPTWTFTGTSESSTTIAAFKAGGPPPTSCCSSTTSGNWHDPATWGFSAGTCSSGVTCPSDSGGNNVVIGDGTTVTCEAGQVCAAGTHPSDDTGAVALQCAVNTSSTSIFAIYGQFIYQGPVRQCLSVWTAYAGATITYDATGVTTPYYSWQIGQTSSAGARLTLAGTSAGHVTWNSADGSETGRIEGNPSAYTTGDFVASYTDFSHVGHAATYSGFAFWYAKGTYTFDNVTCDDCSDLYLGWYPATVFHVKNSKWTNCNNGYSVNVSDLSTGAMTGERAIANSSLCALAIGGAAEATGFTLSNVVLTLPVGSSASVLNVGPSGGSGNSVASLDGMLLWDRYGGSGPNWPTGPLSYGYYFMQQRPTQTNNHGIVQTGVADAIFDHWISQYTGADFISDFYQIYLNKAFRAAFRNSIFLPNAAGEAPTTIFNDQPGGTALSNAIIEQTHTTAVVSAYGGDAGPGICSEANGGSTPTWYAGTLAALEDNVFWRATAGTAIALAPDASGTVNSGAFANVDYNRFFNVTASATTYSSGTWPSGDYVPALVGNSGAHDTYTASLPPFVDRTRSLLNYDQLALGASAAPAWQTSTAYTAGSSIVSTSSAGFFGGATFNWRARQTHTSSSATQPETGSTFEDYWEPAALATIRAQVVAGQPGIHQLVDWVRRGFTATNPKLWCAASDGDTPGAVKFCGLGKALLAAVQ